MTPILEVQDLSVSLGGRRRWLGRSVPPVQAVRGVSLTVAPGEVLGIVGESGCGKTTLGRTILGLQRESGGEILLDGKRVSGLAPQAARRVRNAIHYVHQDAGAALDPWWSIGRTLEEALAIQGIGDRPARVAEVLAAVGLDAGAARRYPHELSGGQLRRVALARILALRPRVVILDEPTSGLDMSVQAMVLTLLRDLRVRYGLTYLFISHDLSVVRRFCDRVAIMYLGRVVELAPAAEVFAAPRHPYTRSLLEAAPRLTGRRAAEAAPLAGEPPSAARLPPGCAFAPRCARSSATCRAEDPALAPLGGAEVACHHPLERAMA
ncbi:oligopeptide/dipeptide ABC transporter ATP-binding protein [Belnapia rosea]|uniref:oligopeptide/dipeptide ABC transporter ATP-binding protein n=1 Tax=Belnapia rosea TaxID=938405 RepID=UPI00088293FC|nr:ABC transporter ATP-binding protein [Belnapia rosea]SDB47353.1 oligopeptide transport system ATP-binding protein [Belnapia rosea]